MCVQKACSVVFTHAIYIVRNATFAYHTSIWIMNCKTGSCLCIQIISSEARTSMGLDCERAKKLFEILLPLTRDVWTRFHYVAGSVCAQTTIFHSTFRFSLSLFPATSHSRSTSIGWWKKTFHYLHSSSPALHTHVFNSLAEDSSLEFLTSTGAEMKRKATRCKNFFRAFYEARPHQSQC